MRGSFVKCLIALHIIAAVGVSVLAYINAGDKPIYKVDPAGAWFLLAAFVILWFLFVAFVLWRKFLPTAKEHDQITKKMDHTLGQMADHCTRQSVEELLKAKRDRHG